VSQVDEISKANYKMLKSRKDDAVVVRGERKALHESICCMCTLGLLSVNTMVMTVIPLS
jgi:hypothetical protein